MRIADLTLRETFIAIPVRKGQGNYEKINQALLDFTSSPSWEALLKQWTGPDSTRL
jgi:ABC-type amino acid transport substrate-binding protein